MYNNQWVPSVVTGSSADPNFPVSNSQHRWFTRTWRSETGQVSDQYLICDRGTPLPSNNVMVFITKFNNFSPTAVVKIQGNASNSWGGPSYDYTFPVINNDVMIQFLGADYYYQYWRHFIDDDSNTDSYIEVGLNYLGPYFEPTRNYDYGEQLPQLDPSSIRASEGGQLSSVVKDKYWTKSFKFSNVTPLEKPYFQLVFDSAGTHKGFFFTEDTLDPYVTTNYVRFFKFDWTYVNWNNWTLDVGLEKMR
jgi:hypothetical protein